MSDLTSSNAPTEFRPSMVAMSLLVFVTFPMGVAFYLVFDLLDSPTWASVSVLTALGGWLVCALLMLFSYVRLDHEGIRSRHFFVWSSRWEDIESWTQWGEGNTVAIMLTNGKVKVPSPACVYGERSNQLAAILEERVGPPSKGKHAVLPPMVKWMAGSLLVDR